jgi:steroid delta-isomerase-like uncharacterized protein
MNATEVAQSNFNSWNRHDADSIVAAYAKGGTYRTPRMGQVLTGSEIGDFAKMVWKAFPDASLELVSIGDTGGGLVAIQWILHGTHTGPLMDGTPPTGRKVSYPGASFVQVEGDKIRSEQTYVDRQTVAELLGLKEN